MEEHDRRTVIFSLGSVLRRGNMLTWITANLGTIVITAALAVMVALILLKIIKDKKKGKSDELLGVSMFLMCYPSFRNLVSGYNPVSPHWIPLGFFWTKCHR